MLLPLALQDLACPDKDVWLVGDNYLAAAAGGTSSLFTPGTAIINQCFIERSLDEKNEPLAARESLRCQGARASRQHGDLAELMSEGGQRTIVRSGRERK